MQILRQKTIQIVILQHNQIPLLKLLFKKNIEVLMAKYLFAGGLPTQDANGGLVGLGFNLGVFKSENKNDVPITQLSIEERRIIIELEGTSADISNLFSEIKGFLTEVAEANEKDFLVPIVVSDESDVIVQLEFSADQLLSTNLYEFVQSDVIQEANNQFGKLSEANIDSISVNFQINYRPTENSLSERRISLNRKDFVIQSAVGYPFSDRMYRSKAPVDTETHIQLLQKLEENFVSKKHS